MERDSKNDVADSFNLIIVDVVSMCKRQTRHASYRHLLQGVYVLGFQAQLVFSHDTSCVAGTPFKLGSTLYCEGPRMQRQDLAGD